jgi:prophage regulatory protein
MRSSRVESGQTMTSGCWLCAVSTGQRWVAKAHPRPAQLICRQLPPVDVKFVQRRKILDLRHEASRDISPAACFFVRLATLPPARRNYRRVRRVPIESNVERLIRLPEVLRRIPVSKSTWWKGVKEGQYPKPVKLSPRVTCWRESDIAKIAIQGRL